LHIYMNIFW